MKPKGQRSNPGIVGSWLRDKYKSFFQTWGSLQQTFFHYEGDLVAGSILGAGSYRKKQC